ncbi:MAG: outer membrane protein transport protein, partial [Paludibacter sp.]|nr:outer membrane protein transport protein [Paludibacter sp.]
MKKIFLIITGILSVTLVSAQSEIDAVKYVQDDIQGTARYMSMAGAFGALGGDVSAIKDNPAGLGIYRGQELSFSLNGQIQSAKSTWGGQTTTDNMFRTKFNNISYVTAMPTWRQIRGETSGLLNMNLAFTYNKLKSIDRNITISGGEMQARLANMMANLANGTGITNENAMGDFGNVKVGWLSVLGYNAYMINLYDVGWLSDFGYMANEDKYQDVIPTYYLNERGYIDEYGFTWSGNFSNRFYLGIGINLQTMAYDITSKYSETVSDNSDWFNLQNVLSANGFGINVSVGGLFKITSALRVSASIHTPTALFLSENYAPELNTKFYQVSPNYTAKDEYVVNRPFYANIGAAYVFGKKGLISAEYVFTDYKSTFYADKDEHKQAFDAENNGMKDMFSNGHTIKIGGEYRVSDNFSVRAGYAMQTSMINEKKADKLMWANAMRTDAEYFVPKTTNYFTLGAGYQEKGWFLDLALMHRRAAQTFMPFSPEYQYDNQQDFPMPKPADISIINNN